MKAKYIKRSEAPVRQYTKWRPLIEEFIRSDAEAMEIDPELGERKSDIYHVASVVRNSIKRAHYDIKCYTRDNKIYLIKS